MQQYRIEAPSAASIASLINALEGQNLQPYLYYMLLRLLEMHRFLKPTGALYLHCVPTTSHHLKLLLDAIFDSKNFRNEIIW